MEQLHSAELLLRRLGSGVRPDGATKIAARAPVDAAAFRALLGRARSGALESGRAVVSAPDAQLSTPLTNVELERIAGAADAAEAAGARRFVALLGDRPLVVDVATRRMVRELRSESERIAPSDVFTGVDAAVAIAPTKSSDEEDGVTDGGARVTPLTPIGGGFSPLGVIDNMSALEALGGLEQVTRRVD